MAARTLNREQIAALLPQQGPFLFLDSAIVDEETVIAEYAVAGAEWIMKYHFQGNPVLPASIAFEAMGQAGCLWLLVNRPTGNGDGSILFSRMDGAQFARKIRPEDTMKIELRLLRCRPPLASFEGTIYVGDEKAAEVETLSLSFDSGKAS